MNKYQKIRVTLWIILCLVLMLDKCSINFNIHIADMKYPAVEDYADTQETVAQTWKI